MKKVATFLFALLLPLAAFCSDNLQLDLFAENHSTDKTLVLYVNNVEELVLMPNAAVEYTVKDVTYPKDSVYRVEVIDTQCAAICDTLQPEECVLSYSHSPILLASQFSSVSIANATIEINIDPSSNKGTLKVIVR